VTTWQDSSPSISRARGHTGSGESGERRRRRPSATAPGPARARRAETQRERTRRRAWSWPESLAQAERRCQEEMLKCGLPGSRDGLEQLAPDAFDVGQGAPAEPADLG